MLRLYTYTSNALADVRARAGKFYSDRISKVRGDESGATAIEYGLIAAGIAVTIIVIVFTLGNDIKGFFENVSSKLQEKKL